MVSSVQHRSVHVAVRDIGYTGILTTLVKVHWQIGIEAQRYGADKVKLLKKSYKYLVDYWPILLQIKRVGCLMFIERSSAVLLFKVGEAPSLHWLQL